MKTLRVLLENCYGIQSFDETFDFDPGPNQNKPKAKAYVIYAPNGFMKSSFAKTFEVLSKNDSPKEERYNRKASWSVQNDGVNISNNAIYVLKAELDISADSPAITDILVNPESKARYDEILVDLDKLKKKLINSLQKSSKVKKDDMEKQLFADFNETSFPVCIQRIKESSLEEDLGAYEYASIFDPKAIDVLNSESFLTKSKDFNERYQKLFDQAGTIYQRGIFNPAKADKSYSVLDNQGFFKGGHRVQLKGDTISVNGDDFYKKIQAVNATIDSDAELKKLRLSLADSAKTQAVTDLIERLSANDTESLLERLKPANQAQFKKDLWAYYIKDNQDAVAYLDSYSASKDEIDQIEASAAQIAPRWNSAVGLFNERFVDMPFTLSVVNQKEATLGREKARLMFTFKDGKDTVEWTRSQIKTLSQGEKRALYILNFIFEVEARKMAKMETLYVLDDIADSFDYKNKHAIVQYLIDLSKCAYFHQIILTHNFDFFRTLATSFVDYNRCLMADKCPTNIKLKQTKGIKNYFIGEWKNKVTSSDRILCATIPFARNIIEYTKGDKDKDYITLTSLMHWMNDTGQKTVKGYLDVYDSVFNTKLNSMDNRPIVPLLFTEAHNICGSTIRNGLNLEDKIVLSMAIRIKAEEFLTNKLRILKNNTNYWCTEENQFGVMLGELQILDSKAKELHTLEKVSVTVSSNLHLNSFMYEPIIDLTIDHLVSLYREICCI